MHLGSEVLLGREGGAAAVKVQEEDARDVQLVDVEVVVARALRVAIVFLKWPYYYYLTTMHTSYDSSSSNWHDNVASSESFI